MKNHYARSVVRPGAKAFFGPLAAFLLLVAAVNAIEAQDASSSAAPSSTAATAGSSMLSHGDKKFIRKVARASTNEVALSQLAESRASSPEVKSFATMMITDHTQANSDLSSLAKAKGIDVRKQVDEGDLDEVSSLSSKSGADFDKAYAKLMVHAHEGAVKLFKDEVATGKDPDVVAFAKKYVDTLSMHLEHATSLEKTVNP